MAQLVEEGGLVLGSVGHGDAFGLVEVDSSFLARRGKFETGEVVKSVGGAVGVCAGVEIEGTADQDGGLLLPDASQGIADLEGAMSEGEGADRSIDGGPEGAVFGDRDEGGPGRRKGGDCAKFSQKIQEFGTIDRVDEVAMGGVWWVLEQLMGQANAQITDSANMLRVGEGKVIPVLWLKLDVENGSDLGFEIVYAVDEGKDVFWKLSPLF